MSAAVSEKIIVLSRDALHAKYGAAVAKIDAALVRLEHADAKRGLKTSVIAIDSAAEMRPFGSPAVPGDVRAAKDAIDAIWRVRQPDYLVLLGAQDVIPFQLLRNPVKSRSDEDASIESDLPYACTSA